MSTVIKMEGGAGLGLNGPAIKRRTFFCGFPYSIENKPFVKLCFFSVMHFCSRPANKSILRYKFWGLDLLIITIQKKVLNLLKCFICWFVDCVDFTCQTGKLSKKQYQFICFLIKQNNKYDFFFLSEHLSNSIIRE